jgi:hypothetical protein
MHIDDDFECTSIASIMSTISEDSILDDTQISFLYFDLIKKICESDGFTTHATLNDNLFHLLATLAWSEAKGGPQNDKHERWLLACNRFDYMKTNLRKSDFFMEHLIRFLPGNDFSESFHDYCAAKRLEMPNHSFLRQYNNVGLETIKVCFLHLSITV